MKLQVLGNIIDKTLESIYGLESRSAVITVADYKVIFLNVVALTYYTEFNILTRTQWDGTNVLLG
jgi:hypothetical protein